MQFFFRPTTSTVNLIKPDQHKYWCLQVEPPLVLPFVREWNNWRELKLWQGSKWSKQGGLRFIGRKVMFSGKSNCGFDVSKINKKSFLLYIEFSGVD